MRILGDNREFPQQGTGAHQFAGAAGVEDIEFDEADQTFFGGAVNQYVNEEFEQYSHATMDSGGGYAEESAYTPEYELYDNREK